MLNECVCSCVYTSSNLAYGRPTVDRRLTGSRISGRQLQAIIVSVLMRTAESKPRAGAERACIPCEKSGRGPEAAQCCPLVRLGSAPAQAPGPLGSGVARRCAAERARNEPQLRGRTSYIWWVECRLRSTLHLSRADVRPGAHTTIEARGRQAYTTQHSRALHSMPYPSILVGRGRFRTTSISLSRPSDVTVRDNKIDGSATPVL